MTRRPLFAAGFGSFIAGVCVLLIGSLAGGQGMLAWYAALFQVGVALLIAGVVLVLARVLIVNQGVLDYV